MHVRQNIVIGSLMLVAGCATDPVAPSIPVFPAPYKPFEVYQREVFECQQFAGDQTRGGAQAANTYAVGSTLLGAALGAAIGGAAAGDGQAAALGAAAGATAGTLYGAAGSQGAQYSLQRRYDDAFAQCMYTKGNQVPGYYGPRNGPIPPPRLPPAQPNPEGWEELMG